MSLARSLTRTQGSKEETIRFLEESAVAGRIRIDENGGMSPLSYSRCRGLYALQLGSWCRRTLEIITPQTRSCKNSVVSTGLHRTFLNISSAYFAGRTT